MDELISIIIPVYNLEVEIKRTLSSILGQTWQKVEIIAVDDGSADDSLAVIQDIASVDSRLRVFHQENSGVSGARLMGIRMAHGKWIGFVDGGDVIEPDMYERLIKNAKLHHADISHCGYQMVLRDRTDMYYGTGRKIVQDQLTGQRDLLEGQFVEPGLCNKLFRKELFQPLLKDNLMDLSIRNLEDLLMNYYLFREARQSVYEDFCPYHYIIQSGSATTGALNEHKLKDPLKVLKIIEQETTGEPLLQNAVQRRIVHFLISLSTMDERDNPELVLPYRKQAREELKERLPAIIKGDYRTRTKLMAASAATVPGTYNKMHKIVSRVKGTDRKYETD